jgi:L-serine dehydratase
MTFAAFDNARRQLLKRIYYSIGGGFVANEAELAAITDKTSKVNRPADVPHPFATANEMLAMGEASGLSIAAMKRINEVAQHSSADAYSDADLDAGLARIWAAMDGCIEHGLAETGTLPGGLKVERRAKAIHGKLKAEDGANLLQPHRVMDWLSVYAMAVNEENAAGGRIVTAPTNGAAGVIPAVIRYFRDHCLGIENAGIDTFLLTAAAIGGIIKHNASISGAEVGCQGEVGSASAMAAAGLCAAMGGTNAQIENAAEIALEHHLGMTCDPIGGLVQVPCIERNALGAVKAVTAASLALRGDGKHFVPLDDCVETMRQTGLDMSEKYKETSTGGLAVNVVEC